MCRKRGRRETDRRWRRSLCQLIQSGGRRTYAALVRHARSVRSRWAAQSPAVLLVGTSPAPRRLRRTVRHAARVYARALGAALPSGTVIVVAPAVQVQGPDAWLASLLEVYAPMTGPRRAVLYLALRADGERHPAEAALLAALRIQIGRELEPIIGSPIQTLAVSLPAERGRRAAPIVPLRPGGPIHANAAVPPDSRHGRPRASWWTNFEDDPA